MDIQYRIYPTLLNTFARFQQGYLTEQELLDRINRVPIPQTQAQAKGVSFEEAVIKGTDEDFFNPEVLRKARALLPRPMTETQVYCQYQLGDVLLYGYVDVVGKTRKTTTWTWIFRCRNTKFSFSANSWMCIGR